MIVKKVISTFERVCHARRQGVLAEGEGGLSERKTFPHIVSKNKTVSKNITKLKPGKKYYVRVCTYKNSHGKKVQGDYSKVRTVKIRK